MSGLAAIVELSGAPVLPGPLAAMGAAAASERGAVPQTVLRGEAGFSCLGRPAAELAEHEHENGFYLVASDARLDNRRELARELRPMLRSLGRDPSEAGASTLVLAAYLRWGEKLAEHLLGDYAFLLWDEGRRRLVAGRDPLGLKTLHYARRGETLLVATEARQLLTHPAVPGELDEHTLGDLLCGNVQAPGRSLFAAIHRLPPAHLLVAGRGASTLSRHWRPEPGMGSAPRTEHEAAEAVHEVLAAAVRDRLEGVSDPVAVSISGGLDSCSVAALARRTLPPEKLLLASMTFPGLPRCDERPWVETMASALGLGVEWVDAERHAFGAAAVDRGSPEGLGECWGPSYSAMLERLRRRGSRMLLTGIGGDDLLAGSSWVYADRLAAGDVRPLRELWRHARGQGKSPWRFFYCYLAAPFLPAALDVAIRRWTGRTGDRDTPPWLAPRLLSRTGLRERTRRVLPRAARGRGAAAEIRQAVEPGSFGSAVCWLDRRSARYGIEVRHPFLDRRLAELVLSMPPRLLFRLGAYKPVLRRAMAGVLPEQIRLRRDKTRLGAYLDATMVRLAPRVRRLLAAPLLERMGLVEGGELRRAAERYLRGHTDSGIQRVWHALMMEIWLQKHYSAGNFSDELQVSAIGTQGFGSAAPV